MKLATLYWAWAWPTGLRKSFKQRLDPQCMAPYVDLINEANQSPNDCPICSGPCISGDYALIWVTAYIPGAERLDTSMAMHPACFNDQVQHFTEGAVQMPDRHASDGGPKAPLPENPWASLGIKPVAST